MDENDSLLVKLQVTESKGEERKKGKEKRKKDSKKENTKVS